MKTTGVSSADPAVLSRFYDRPLALLPRAATELLTITAQYNQPEDKRPYLLVGHVAVIPISGVLVASPTYWFDEQTYSDIGASFQDAMENPEVKAVAFAVNSPGGEVSGLFDLVDGIYSARGEKPMLAIVDDLAASAAFAIASAADHICLPRTGTVGSVGVVAIHMDVTGMMDNIGIKPTLIQFGARKADYSPFKPLSSEARESMQADVDDIGKLFVETVARNRGMTTKAVKATEAGLFMGPRAVSIGFACLIQAPRRSITALQRFIR